MKKYVVSLIVVVVIGLGAAQLFTRSDEPSQSSAVSSEDNWQANWGVLPSFSIEKDSDGYRFPTAIAFVPTPGEGPKDALYFVTELRHGVKVVSNDRSVHSFANGFFPSDEGAPVQYIPDEFGLTGLCLDPVNGYVFVTFSFPEGNQTKNGFGRFETVPGTFALQPSSYVDYSDILTDFPTGPSHIIGGCQVVADNLYISIGDGHNIQTPPIPLEQLRGKILRLNLDGEPKADNPFYLTDQADAAANYVWALGLRNPFGLKAVGEQLFAADNGNSVDRFVEIVGGKDYLWDGSDLSIGTFAKSMFIPAIGPAQLEFVPATSGLFPEQYENSFYVAMSAELYGGIMQLSYDLADNAAVSVPQVFLRYIGPRESRFSGAVTGLALGPDGLYFAPLLPNGEESGTVYRIRHNPSNQHPYGTTDITNPSTLMSIYNCLECHSLGENGGNTAPVLDKNVLVPELRERLSLESYLQSLDEIDGLEDALYQSYEVARKEVRQAKGDERVSVWMVYHIMEPKFDNPNAQMPNLGLSQPEAEVIADYLIKGDKVNPIPELTNVVVYLVSNTPGFALFVIGLGIGIASTVLIVRIRSRRSQEG